ncbi:MAG: heme/hemin ABC transporter substrate-binding protein [Gammaproteobacteria bacterium]
MAATLPPKRLARAVASGARQWGARLGAFLLGLWIALFGSMWVGAETAATEGQRIVAVGGELTEIVYALGAEARLVGVDTTSRWPAAARALPKVGYMRNLSAEGVLSLAPTLVLCTTHAGPPVILSQLREAGVPLLILPAEPNVAGAEAKIRGVAGALGLETQGEAMVRTLRSRVERALAGIPAGAGPRVLFLMGLQQGALIAAGAGTSAQAMIELAGGTNALRGFSGYRPISPEALAQARPEVLLVPEHALGAMGGAEGILSRPGIEVTCAGRNRRLVFMDGLYLLGFGPRLGEAVTDLAQALREPSACTPSALTNHSERGARGG